jgi:hypothetical protein
MQRPDVTALLTLAGFQRASPIGSDPKFYKYFGTDYVGFAECHPHTVELWGALSLSAARERRTISRVAYGPQCQPLLARAIVGLEAAAARAKRFKKVRDDLSHR